MSDVSVIAVELQDLAQSVDEVAAAIRAKAETAVIVNVPEQPPANIAVNVPQAQAPTVIVNVPEQAPALAPTVNVAAPHVQVDPTLVVERATPTAYAVTITRRDDRGFISEFVIEPIQSVLT